MKTSRLVRLVCGVVAVAALGGVALIAQQAQTPTTKMVATANALIAQLNAEQKSQALFGLDDEHRTKWYFTPQQTRDRQTARKGLRYDHLTDAQRKSVHDLLRAGLSGTGYKQATTIMGLESLLAELQGKSGTIVRNPQWYFISIFGEPSNTGNWGWRFEGHHLSINVTLDKGRVISASPTVFASNPATIRSGPRKGERALPEAEDAANKLIASLTEEQKKIARQTTQFPEIKEGQPDAAVGEPVGITAAQLNAEQKSLLWKLIAAYANRMTTETAKQELDRAKAAGEDKLYFGYCVEEKKPGGPNTYRVQGPTFVVEYLNVQADASKNPANHIHSGWRQLPLDFGLTAKK